PDRNLYKELLRRGIALRQINKPGNWLRVTIGTAVQMKQFLKELALILRIRKYAVIDRDGTLAYEPPQTKQIDSVGQLRILPGAIRALKFLYDAGYKLIMVSNQDGMGTPGYPLASFKKVQAALLSQLKKAGIKFDAILVCPHMPNELCLCRKPQTK